jgi:hypothetical protein
VRGPHPLALAPLPAGFSLIKDTEHATASASDQAAQARDHALDPTYTPLQRPARFANQEFFTEAQREELDKARSAMLDRDRRLERGTEADVSGAYNSVFLSVKRIGMRTSLIVDPPNGRLPPLTAEAQKITAAEREYRVALLQAT